MFHILPSNYRHIRRYNNWRDKRLATAAAVNYILIHFHLGFVPRVCSLKIDDDGTDKASRTVTDTCRFVKHAIRH